MFSIADESSSEEDEEPVNSFDSPVLRRHMKGSRFVEGLKGICEGNKYSIHSGIFFLFLYLYLFKSINYVNII